MGLEYKMHESSYIWQLSFIHNDYYCYQEISNENAQMNYFSLCLSLSLSYSWLCILNKIHRHTKPPNGISFLELETCSRQYYEIDFTKLQHKEEKNGFSFILENQIQAYVYQMKKESFLLIFHPMC